MKLIKLYITKISLFLKKNRQTFKTKGYTANLPYLYSWVQICGFCQTQIKNIEEKKQKVPECSKTQSSNLSRIGSYLHNIYIVLDIICSLEMIQSTQEDVCRLCENIMPLYIWDLSILGFWSMALGVLKLIPSDKRDDCIMRTAALLYIFAIFLNARLKKSQLDSHMCFCIQSFAIWCFGRDI